MLSLCLQLLNEGRHSDSRIRSFACTAGAQKTIAHLCKVKAKAINFAPPYFEHRTDNDIHQMPRTLRSLLHCAKHHRPHTRNGEQARRRPLHPPDARPALRPVRLATAAFGVQRLQSRDVRVRFVTGRGAQDSVGARRARHRGPALTVMAHQSEKIETTHHQE